MAVKKTNTRITITISNKQYNWLCKMCETKGMKMSKLISWLLWNKSKDVEHTKQLLENPTEALANVEEEITDEEMDEILSRFNKLINKA